MQLKIVTVQTEEGKPLGKVEIVPFSQTPKVLRWGAMTFLLHQVEPEIIYRECFVAVSGTSLERAIILESSNASRN
jgi:hypothetical protein